jgi:V/A-type H+-transporting ATPase subunit I
MAIDSVLEFAAAFPHRKEDEVLSALFGAGLVHLTSYTPSSEAPLAQVPGVEDVRRSEREVALAEVARDLDLASATLAFFAEIDPPQKGLVQSFFPDETYVTREDIARAAATHAFRGYTDMMEDALALKGQLEDAQHRLGTLEHEMEALLLWRDLPLDVSQTLRWKYLSVMTGTVPSASLTALLQRLDAAQVPARVEVVAESKTAKALVVACLRTHENEVRSVLASEGFTEQDLARIGGTAGAVLERLGDEARHVRARAGDLRVEVGSALAHRKELLVYREYLINERARLEAGNDLTRTQHCSVVTGFVRADDAGRLQQVCASVDGTVCMTGETTRGDDTPVSITNPRWLKPMEILINMFGYPVYSSFDPTGFVILPFLLFFGLCLGDAVYGIFEIALCFTFIRKYRASAGVRRFMTLFIYGGVAAIIVGALTGSWAGDLLSETYLGRGNPVSKLVSWMALINPTEAAFQFLIIVWIIGGVNQLYGVGLAIYKAARRKDYASILYDCVGWLLFLPALSALLFIGTKWGPGFRIGYLAALVVGLVLLLLGGARQAKGPAKLLTALVNLYGIQSSYGVGSFLGDVLSYSRLLALGLTTASLASAFNMIAGLVRFPSAGVVIDTLVRVTLGGVILLVGHLLNYFMGAMGAFIHSARLILLEFFGRFYEGGAPRFHRFGFSSEVVKVVEGSVNQRKQEESHGT